MVDHSRTIAITGAGGYLGSRLCDRLDELGFRVVRLSRSASSEIAGAREFHLDRPMNPEQLRDVDVLIHAAYDMKLTNADAIRRVNVSGSASLIRAATLAGVRRVIVLSSMSAFTGTTQLYGRAKLEIEAIALQEGAVVVRPGLVYGPNSEGMVGALRKLARFPAIPILMGTFAIYPVHEDDFVSVIVSLVEAEDVPPRPIGLAQSNPVNFRELLFGIWGDDHKRPLLIPVPWQLPYVVLRTLEALRIKLPFRADSLLGLVKSATSVPGKRELEGTGVTIRRFPSEAPEA